MINFHYDQKINNLNNQSNYCIVFIHTKGIPYASPPVGRLRLMPPVTPVPWNEDRDFNSYGPVCPQQLPNLSNETEALTRMTSYRYNNLKRLLPLLKNQSEDCLYLNIYLPAKGKQLIVHNYIQQFSLK